MSIPNLHNFHLTKTGKFCVLDAIMSFDLDLKEPEMQTRPQTIKECAVRILMEGNLRVKAQLTKRIVEDWENGGIAMHHADEPHIKVPTCPNRELTHSPSCIDSNKSLRKNAIEFTIHGIATAESFAIDLFWDCIARFHDNELPKEYYDDLVRIAGQEADHFLSWADRLDAIGCPFGSLPMHDGLWKAAQDTADNILARIAVINLIHEARGLDTYPITLGKLLKVGDEESIRVLNKNVIEEIHHVAVGVKWFKYICDMKRLPYIATFHKMYSSYFKGKLKGPFNTDARHQAGLTEEWYLPLS